MTGQKNTDRLYIYFIHVVYIDLKLYDLNTATNNIINNKGLLRIKCSLYFTPAI